MEMNSRRIGLVIAYGMLLVIVDTVATVVALPALVADLDTTLPRGSWATTAYLIGVISIIPIAGWLAGRYGDRRVYLLGIAVFTAAGFAAGASPSIEVLIALRFLQGIGGGVFQPLGSAIALRAVDRDHRGAMMALLGLPLLIGPVAGPAVMGWLVDATSWRWLFWTLLPLGLLAFVLCIKLLPTAQFAPSRQPADWFGLALVIPGCLMLVLACTSIGEAGHATQLTAASGIAGLVGLAWFTRRSLRQSNPLLRIDLLKHRIVATAAGVLATFTAGYFGSSVILPAYVQGVRGDSVSIAGLLAVPTGLAVGITAQIATRLIDHHPARRVILTGTTIALIGALGLGILLTSGAPYWAIGATSILVGVGSGATLMPTMATASRDLDGIDLTGLSALFSLIQQLGTAIGTALVATTITITVNTLVDLPASSGGGLSAMVDLPPDLRAGLAGPLAQSVGLSYGIPALLVLIAAIVTARGFRTPALRQSPRPTTYPGHT